jgi:uncharacterized protein
MPTSVELQIAFVVAVFAGVQSLFGVGLLVFGTPTLLLLGLPFDQILLCLLPSSMTISFLQILSGGGFGLDSLRKQFLVFACPTVLIGTVVVLTWGPGLNIRAVVGAMLLMTGAIRLLRRTREVVAASIRLHVRPSLTMLGIIHGLSNLGGGILTLIVSSLFADKTTVRRQVAFCYGVMASIQLAVVFLTGPPRVPVGLAVTLPVVAAITFVSLGQWAFGRTSQATYQRGLTAILLAYGAVLVLT